MGLPKIPYIVGSLATIFYCAFIWYAGNLFVIVSGLNSGAPVSRFSMVAIAPLDLPPAINVIHWQLLAVASLLVSLVISLRHPVRFDNSNLTMLPLVNHYGILLLLLLFHLLGFLVPMVPDCASIA